MKEIDKDALYELIGKTKKIEEGYTTNEPKKDFWYTINHFLSLSFKEQRSIIINAILYLMNVRENFALIANEDYSSFYGVFRSSQKIIMESIAKIVRDDRSIVISDLKNKPRIDFKINEYCDYHNLKSSVRSKILKSSFIGIDLYDENEIIAIKNIQSAISDLDKIIFLVDENISDDEKDKIMSLYLLSLYLKKKVLLVITTNEVEQDKHIQHLKSTLSNKFIIVRNKIYTLLEFFQLNYTVYNNVNLESMAIVPRQKYQFLLYACGEMVDALTNYDRYIDKLEKENSDLSFSLEHVDRMEPSKKLIRENEELKQTVSKLEKIIKEKDDKLENYAMHKYETELFCQSLKSRRDSDKEVGYYKNLPKSEIRRERSHDQFMDYYYSTMIYRDENLREDIGDFIRKHVNMY